METSKKASPPSPRDITEGEDWVILFSRTLPVWDPAVNRKGEKKIQENGIRHLLCDPVGYFPSLSFGVIVCGMRNDPGKCSIRVCSRNFCFSGGLGYSGHWVSPCPFSWQGGHRQEGPPTCPSVYQDTSASICFIYMKSQSRLSLGGKFHFFFF